MRLLPMTHYPGNHGEGGVSLQDDPALTTETKSNRVYIASGVSLGRDVVANGRVRIAPAIGVSVAASEALSGQQPDDLASGMVYAQLPVRLAVTREAGVMLEAIIGGRANVASSRIQDTTGRSVGFEPTVTLTAQLDL